VREPHAADGFLQYAGTAVIHENDHRGRMTEAASRPARRVRGHSPFEHGERARRRYPASGSTTRSAPTATIPMPEIRVTVPVAPGRACRMRRANVPSAR
jgi:hypothetical protein